MRSLLRHLTAGTPLGFSLRLAVCWSPLIAFVVMRPLRAAVEEPLTRVYAVIASGTLNLLGAENTRQGAVLLSRSGDVAVEIAPVCTGYFLFWLYAGAVVAFPAPWTSRLKGIAGGAILIFTLNVVRNLSLYYVLGAHPELFDEIHLVVWQSITVLAVSIAWYVWASRGPIAAPAAA